MPTLPGDSFRVGVGVHRQDLRVAFGAARVGMDRQFTEQTAERLVLIQGQLLVAEEQHLMRHQRVVHFLELLIAQEAGEIDAGDLGTDGGGGGRDRDP